MSKQEPLVDRTFWMTLRQHWLGMVAIVEKKLGITPTTKQKTDWWKQHSGKTANRHNG